MVSGEHYTTLSLVLPLYQKLLHHIKSEIEATDTNDIFREAIGAALVKIQRYHEKTTVTAIVATVLDPRFKTYFFFVFFLFWKRKLLH